MNDTIVRKSSDDLFISLFLFYSCRFGNMPRNRNSKERRARRVYIHLKGNNHHWVGNTVVDDDAPTPLPTKPEAKIDSNVITTADGSQNEQKPAVFFNSDTIVKATRTADHLRTQGRHQVRATIKTHAINSMVFVWKLVDISPTVKYTQSNTTKSSDILFIYTGWHFWRAHRRFSFSCKGYI